MEPKKITEIGRQTNGVYVHAVLGTAGTTGSLGTATNPVSNIADALVIAAARDTNVIYICSDVQLAADLVAAWTFIGIGNGAEFDVNSHDCAGSHFHNLTIASAVYVAADSIFCFNCRLASLNIAQAVLYDTDMPAAGTVSVLNLTWIRGMVNGAILDVHDAAGPATWNVFKLGGTATVQNMVNAGSALVFQGENLFVEIDASCVAGTALFEGNVLLTNNAAPAIVSDISNTAQRIPLRFASVPFLDIDLTAVAGNIALPTLTVPNLLCVPMHGHLILKCRMCENTNVAANSVDGNQIIEVSEDAGVTWHTAIHIPTGYLAIAASTREGGDVVMGDEDIGQYILSGGTLQVRWTAAKAAQNDLHMYDCQLIVETQ